jgi:hypothetical protein
MSKKAMPLLLLSSLLPGIAGALNAAAPDHSPGKAGALPGAPALSLLAPGVNSAAGQASDTARDPKLSSHLARLIAAERSSRLAGRAIDASDLSGLPPDLQSLVDTRLMRIDDAGQVQVYVRAEGSVAAVEDVVRRAGGRVERSSTDARMVQAVLPLLQVEQVAHDPAVRFVRLPDYGFPQVGSVTTEGDRILEASLVRSTFGVDGSGVRVGVISSGINGLPASVASGDLPSNVDSTTCNVTGANPAASGAEATAMLEIVHDLAPGASLMFGNFSHGAKGLGTTLDFANAVSCLAANNDVVVDDISFIIGGPYDGTSFVSQNTSAQLNNPANPIRAYVTAAANQAQAHYEEGFHDSGFTISGNGGHTEKVHQFLATSITTDAGDEVLCSKTSTKFCANAVRIAAGQSFVVFLQWDDPFGASSNDYDLFLLDAATGAVVASSQSPQTGTQDPIEALAWTNKHATGDFWILIALRSGVEKNLSLWVPSCSEGVCAPFGNGTELNFNTASLSIPNQADAGGGVITTGAIRAVDPQDPHNVVIEPYSGQGPTADGRIKPEVTGIDGVQVTGNGGFFTPFFGTSAAAPHIAGIAALLLAARPDFLAGGSVDAATARGFLEQFILTGAYRLGPATGQLTEPQGAIFGNDVFGAGRANALASAELFALPASCTADASTLCIDNQTGDKRFFVKVLYDATAGPAGLGQALPLSSLGVTQGGLYWFFNATNPEMLVKVLNGCPVNNDFWIFYAAGTNVGLTVIVFDTVQNQYIAFTNPDGTAAPPIQDTSAFACTSTRRGDESPRDDSPLAAAAPLDRNGGFAFTPLAEPRGNGDAAAPSGVRPVPRQAPVIKTAAARSYPSSAGSNVASACVPTATKLCVDGRFAIQVAFDTGSSSGMGTAIPLGSIGVTEGGLFWFFNSTNPEMLVKVIDACSLNNQHWVFFSAGTNVGLTVTVTDTQTGASRQYTNPNGTAAVPVQDTAALPCP